MLARLAHQAARHPRRLLVLAFLAVLVAGVFGGPVAGALQSSGGFTATDSDSARAEDRIEQATDRDLGTGVVLLVATPEGAGSAQARGRLAALRGQLAAVPGIGDVSSGQGPGTTAADGRSAIVAATVRASADDDDVAEAVLDRFEATPDVTVGGSAVASFQIGDAVTSDLGRAETIALPILVLLTLVFFRGRQAAAIPLAVGIATVLGTFLVLAIVNVGFALSIFALNLVIGLGLGLAIDYSLFLLSRFREELAVPGPGAVAIGRTLQSAGRTVVFSAVTVAIALATLLVFPLNFLQSMGVAGAASALVAALASLVIAPALFAVWGARLATKRTAVQEQDTRWYRLSHGVMRRPGTIAVLASVVMLAMALPALRTTFTPVDAAVIPKGDSARTVADALVRDFPRAGASPVSVVISDGPTAEQVQAVARRLGALPGARAVAEPVRLDATTWQVDVTPTGDPSGDPAQGIVRAARDLGSSAAVSVGGPAARFVDQQATIGDRLPLAIGLLGLAVFVVLWLMTGSVVLPLKAIVMNLLTVGASLGAVTLVFQDGRFEGLLGYTGNGGIEPTDFLVAAALVFALSTDYGVFLLGRIKEAREEGVGEREAVAVGLQRTGAVVTAASILLAVAIGAFLTSSISFIQQIGLATATGVLFDAFVVRTLLVPSLMALLGSRNWWSPAPLARLHARVAPTEHDGAVEPTPAAAAAG